MTHQIRRSFYYIVTCFQPSLPNIVTISSKAVPNDESDSGDYSESGITRSDQEELNPSVVADVAGIQPELLMMFSS